MTKKLSTATFAAKPNSTQWPSIVLHRKILILSYRSPLDIYFLQLHRESKNETLYSYPQFRQILTDFQNYLTIRLNKKSEIKKKSLHPTDVRNCEFITPPRLLSSGGIIHYTSVSVPCIYICIAPHVNFCIGVKNRLICIK